MLATLSTVTDGNMHPSLDPEGPPAQANFEAFCRRTDIDHKGLVGLRIDPRWRDGARVVTALSADVVFGEVDCKKRERAHAVILGRDVGAFVLSADCYPFRLVSSEHHAVGHIGWRSVEDNLLGVVVEQLRTIGYEPGAMELEVGPGIAAESNVVPLNRASQLNGKNASFWLNHARNAGRGLVGINLFSAIIEQARAAGIKSTNITADIRDTYTDPDLFSRRASLAGDKANRGNHVFIAQAER